MKKVFLMDGYVNVNREEKVGGRRRGCRVVFMVLAVFFGILQGQLLQAASKEKASTRVIVDMAGREVRIPAIPKRIACLDGPAYEKVFAFGAADRVVLVPNILLPWNYALNPNLESIPTMANFTAPDVEHLLDIGTDLVIFKPFSKPIKSMAAAGIPVVVAYDGSKRQKTMEDFIQDCYAQIRFYGRILGGDGEDIAEKYCSYVDGKIRKVLTKTCGMTEAQRPRVFYYSGATNGPAGTQSRYTTAWWLVQAAGGTMMTYDDSSYFVSVSTEQMILWNPDFIVASTGPSIDSILGNPHFQGIKAVKAGNVIKSPEGVFYWTHFSTESFLLILYLAKHFHPVLFADLDVGRELKDYYTRFYHYKLSDDEAQRILSCLPPEN